MTDKVEVEKRQTREGNPEGILRSKPFSRQVIAFGIRAPFAESHSVAEFIGFADEKIDILRKKHRISGVKPVVEHQQKTDKNKRQRENHRASELHFLREHEYQHADIDKKSVLRTDKKRPGACKPGQNEKRLSVFRYHHQINREQSEHQIEGMRHIRSTHKKIERTEKRKEHRKKRSLRPELSVGYFTQ